MKRADAITWIRIAGYHNDQKSFVRLYVENRVSRAAADEAWAKGVKAKQSGMGCACHQRKNQPPGEHHEIHPNRNFPRRRGHPRDAHAAKTVEQFLVIRGRGRDSAPGARGRRAFPFQPIRAT